MPSALVFQYLFEFRSISVQTEFPCLKVCTFSFS